MKKFIFALVMLFTMTVSASAMSYEEARNEALFLTDKMAYELNLTEDQYEAAYEINLDYLMRVNTVDDLYGTYWRYRNLDMSYILFDWQYRAFCDAAYFYRPIYWSGGYWHFGIYARYPYRDYFYFGCPRFYVEYRGGHSWRMNGGHSWYRGRDWGRPGNRPAVGMRDGFNRGDYRNVGNRSFGNLNNRGSFNNSGSRSFGSGASMAPSTQNRNTNTTGPRKFGTFGSGRNYNSVPQSSTRTTVTQQQGRNLFDNQSRTMNRSSFQPQTAPSRSFSAPSRTFSEPSRSFSSPSRSFGSPSNSGSFGGSRSSGGSFSNGGSRSFGGHR